MSLYGKNIKLQKLERVPHLCAACKNIKKKTLILHHKSEWEERDSKCRTCRNDWL
jgi:hypothetical protein